MISKNVSYNELFQVKKLSVWTIATLVVICIGIVLRLWRLDIPFDPEDVHLDYVAAHHLVSYGEIPLSGSGNPLLIDSPLYYYIVAFFVFLRDDLLFLGIVNIVLIQGITFALFYGIGRTLFDRRVGFLAVVFAVFSLEYTLEGAYFFQTHVMQLFVNAAFFFLALAYRYPRLRYIYTSVGLFMTALTIHHSILALLPVYSVVIAFLLSRQKYPKGIFLNVGIFAVCVLAAFHLPILLLMTQDHSVIGRIASNVSGGFVHSVSEFGERLMRNILQFFYAFSLRWMSSSVWINSLLGVLLGVGGILFVRSLSRHKEKKYAFIFVGLFILQIIFIASVLRVGVWNFTFSSVYGLFLVGISACVAAWFTGSVAKKVMGVGIVCLSLFALSNNFVVFEGSIYGRLYRASLTKESGEAIQQKIVSIQKKEGYENPLFFRIQRVHKDPGGLNVDVYTDNGIQVIEDLLYWPVLEKQFSMRFVRMELDGYFPSILSGDDYVFVICDSTRVVFEGPEECIDLYIREHAEYAYVEPIYARFPLTIVLMRKLVLDSQ